MTPRFLGCAAVITKSFARIHETNLKKQGVLPLTFVNPDDYDLIQESDKLSIIGITELAPGSSIKVIVSHDDGTVDEFDVNHTYSRLQIEWFKHGSALNMIAAKSNS